MSKIIAIVGMPGAGKSQAALFFQNKNIPIVRFGDLTEETIREKGLPLTVDNERNTREELRKELGMAAYAIKAYPKIDTLSKIHPVVVLDGLYSWEEYILLKKHFPKLILLYIFAASQVRYSRLSIRKIRPLTRVKAIERDNFEVENLNKGGPIAIADYLIKNESTVGEFHNQLEIFLKAII